MPLTRHAKDVHKKWLQPSIIPLLIVIVVGIFIGYATISAPPEFRSLESFTLENELLLISYGSLLLSTLSWWLMFVLYGKGAYYSKNHIWPSPFTAGALFCLATTVTFAITILGSDEDLNTKLFGFFLTASATTILTLKDHQQLMRRKKIS